MTSLLASASRYLPQVLCPLCSMHGRFMSTSGVSTSGVAGAYIRRSAGTLMPFRDWNVLEILPGVLPRPVGQHSCLEQS